MGNFWEDLLQWLKKMAFSREEFEIYTYWMDFSRVPHNVCGIFKSDS